MRSCTAYVCFQGKADMAFGNQLPLQIPNEEAANQGGLPTTNGTHGQTSGSEQRQDRHWPQQDPKPMQSPIASAGAHRRSVIWATHDFNDVRPWPIADTQSAMPNAFYWDIVSTRRNANQNTGRN